MKSRLSSIYVGFFKSVSTVIKTNHLTEVIKYIETFRVLINISELINLHHDRDKYAEIICCAVRGHDVYFNKSFFF